MRLSLRFVVPLFLALGIFAYAAVPLVDRLMLSWFSRDLDIRANLIANTIEEPLQGLIQSGNKRRVLQFFTRLTQDERLYAVAFCPADDGQLLATPTFPKDVTCGELDPREPAKSELRQTAQGPVLVSVRPLVVAEQPPAGAAPSIGAALGELILVHDMSFIARRSRETREYLFLFFVGLGLTVALITVVIAQLSWRGWVAGMRALLRGERVLMPARSKGSGPPPEFQPIAKDLRALIEALEADHRSRDVEQLAWTPETLREILHRELRGQEVIVVSNREPYIHMRRGTEIEVWRPASGLVTALEPIMRACSGIWIAHGSGSADRETVDEHDRVALPPPPDEATYQLRRVWLSAEEETGYYYGFANEGLWPLCHVAHVRPVFRTTDWEEYVRVNRKFAKTVVQEARSSNP
ncbi:MAG TPA: trehalose-6-phosphate synthase, partial [Gemmatimonadales bacterium]|nr:trehalose-6-phosphate synthase [Gemmatimonadales bacterium]